MTTVLMVAHGTDGDVAPVIRIGAELQRRGHRVALLTHARYSRRTRAAGIRFVAVDTVAADADSQADGVADLNSIGERTDLAAVRDYYERHGFGAQLRFECRALRRLHRPGETVLVGLSLSCLSVLTAAELLGAPAVCLAASPHHLAVLDRAAAEYAEIFGTGVDLVRAEFGLPGIADWVSWLGSAGTRIGTWPAWFDAAGARAPDGVHLTGFVLGDEDGPAAGPLPEAVTGDAVLVAGSTGALSSARFYRSAVSAAVATGRPVIVATRSPELLPDPLPSGVRWFPHLPFREVVPQVAAVIHHGGIGVSARALVSGTPQLILPSGFDRPDNARRLAAVSLAHWLPQSSWEPDAVLRQLDAVLARGRVTLPQPLSQPIDAVSATADVVDAL
ncbi:UDP:flavonoid glycosyltransferase YjiC (YdhE family) [Allocatelliglobosispora scoriae]|uniref:UDP:flavonoid glycosyltransferase YjiC (YdhE family) n=1 Tax=Allocatelliglobosispora scoriae TaxID=643052 RepID=A0A841C2G2_9ACTN|nr:nucleotide disphospho-sugar-binding domain-containing protein [Allocatelliglobosispora scoriae]MBB5874105.1 UDP:flavonoid glycosyltransferase YjiC (YdhE family) [Allocatelliglobosispora scoriae]